MKSAVSGSNRAGCSSMLISFRICLTTGANCWARSVGTMPCGARINSGSPKLSRSRGQHSADGGLGQRQPRGRSRHAAFIEQRIQRFQQVEVEGSGDPVYPRSFREVTYIMACSNIDRREIPLLCRGELR